MNRITFDMGNGLTLSIAQLQTDPFKRDAPEIALIDKNGEFVTDNYNNSENDLTGGGETIEKATFEQLTNLLKRVAFSGPPREHYYDEKQFKNEQIIIEPIAANAAKLEQATRPAEDSDNWIENILKGTPLEITPDEIERFEQRKRQAGK